MVSHLLSGNGFGWGGGYAEVLSNEFYSHRIERMSELRGMRGSCLEGSLALLLSADLIGWAGDLATGTPSLAPAFSIEVCLRHAETPGTTPAGVILAARDDLVDNVARPIPADERVPADDHASADHCGSADRPGATVDPVAVDDGLAGTGGVTAEGDSAGGAPAGGVSSDGVADADSGEIPASAAVPVEVVPADLSDDGLLDAILECDVDTARRAGRKMVLINELAHRRAGEAVTELLGRRAHGEYALSLGTRAVGDELALLLRVSRSYAEKQAFTAVGLCTEATYALDALAAGEIDLAKAEAILDYTQTLLNDTRANDPESDPEALAEAFQRKVLKKAGSQTLRNMRDCASRALIKVDPAAAERRCERKRQRRHLSLVPDSDSMCYLTVYLPADQGVRIVTALKVLAEAAWSEGIPGPWISGRWMPWSM